MRIQVQSMKGYPIYNSLAGTNPMLNILGFRQRRALRKQCLLISPAVQRFRIHEKAIQIKNDGSDHALCFLSEYLVLRERTSDNLTRGSKVVVHSIFMLACSFSRT